MNKKPAERFKTLESAQIEVYGQNGTIPVTVVNLSKTGALVKVQKINALQQSPPTTGDILNVTVYLYRELPAIRRS